MKHDTRTLLQRIVAAGFLRQKDFLDHLAAKGIPIPQPSLSAMCRGDQSHPQARERAAEGLGISVAAVERAIANGSLARVLAKK